MLRIFILHITWEKRAIVPLSFFFLKRLCNTLIRVSDTSWKFLEENFRRLKIFKGNFLKNFVIKPLK